MLVRVAESFAVKQSTILNNETVELHITLDNTWGPGSQTHGHINFTLAALVVVSTIHNGWKKNIQMWKPSSYI